nr:unnamed protein product [Digitaria exilis]
MRPPAQSINDGGTAETTGPLGNVSVAISLARPCGWKEIGRRRRWRAVDDGRHRPRPCRQEEAWRRSDVAACSGGNWGGGRDLEGGAVHPDRGRQ